MQPSLRRTQRRALIGPSLQASGSRDYGDSPTTRTPLLSDAKNGVTRTTPKPLDKHENRGIRPRSIALASGPRRRVVGPMDAHLLANTRLVGNMQVFTPIVEEPPDPVEGQPSASPAAQAPPSLPPARPTSEQPSHNGFYYFKDVVDAQARGDIQAVSGRRLFGR